MMQSEQSGCPEFTVEMVDPQAQLLRDIEDRRMTRDDVAMTYAFAIRQGETNRIGEVNRRILDRWSMAALSYIKTEAWRLVEGKPPRKRALRPPTVTHS